jgi:hypothetical protein
MDTIPYNPSEYEDTPRPLPLFYLLKDCFFIVFDSSAKFPVGLLAGNQYQMGHYDECVEILVDSEERSGGQLKGQYCLAEIRFESSFSHRTDIYTLKYDPQASAWEKIKVRNNKESVTANNMSTDLFV